MSEPKLVVVCFLPDTGHVIPLLRMADTISRRSACDVMCFLAGRFESAVRQYGFQFRSLAAAGGFPPPFTIGKLANKSIFYSAFSNHFDLRDYYWAPLREAVSRDLGNLLAELKELQPEWVLCDSHLFLDWYEQLARCCQARLVVNHSEGTLRRFRRVFDQTYGLTDGKYWPTLVEYAGIAAQYWFRFWRVTCHRHRRAATRTLVERAAQRASVAFRDCAAQGKGITQITSGLAPLEPHSHEMQENGSCGTELFLFPTITSAVATLPEELGDWLGRREAGTVVYVSFGTLVSANQRFLETIAQGLLDANVSVIWSLPQQQRELLGTKFQCERVRVEEFVPQTALLASPKIGCFVTHGGANSVQEAIVNAKPMLCIPFIWDQPYNAALAERFGVAIRLSRRRATGRRVAEAVTRLLAVPMYKEQAEGLAAEIRKGQRQQQESDWIADLLAQGD